VVKTSSTAELLRTFGDKVNAGPASEQAILAFNATNPPVKLVGVGLDPAPALLTTRTRFEPGYPGRAHRRQNSSEPPC